MKEPKIAIVADWLTNFAGAESVIESMTRIFPAAPLYTTVFIPENMKDLKNHKNVHTSFLQKLPKFLKKRHRALLPILPYAIESLDLNQFDIVLSSSSFVGKGVLTNPNTLHICYCHTPTRFLWGDWRKFLKDYPLPKIIKIFLPKIFHKLRIWDKMASHRPNKYIANSDFIQKRIKKFYKKDSIVLSPPVDTSRFSPEKEKLDYFLFLGRLVPQKNIDFLIRAFCRMPQKRLIIAGDGPMKTELKNLAKNASNIEFLGFVADKNLPSLYAQAQALIFPQIEDAGITPLESLASGTPVIALKKGGALNTLNEKVAIFFHEQTESSLLSALERFEKKQFLPTVLQKHAKKFSREIFEKHLKEIVEKEWKKFNK